MANAELLLSSYRKAFLLLFFVLVALSASFFVLAADETVRSDAGSAVGAGESAVFCEDENLCREIDNVWGFLSGVIEERSGEVWQASGRDSGTWMRASSVYEDLAPEQGDPEVIYGSDDIGMPLSGTMRLTSPFGSREINDGLECHGGLDFGASTETEVYAIADGVATASSDGTSGNYVRIRHTLSDGVVVDSYYMHLSSTSVNSGSTVSKGDVVGIVGNTGYSTGPHLHLQISRSDGTAVNPYCFYRHFDVDLSDFVDNPKGFELSHGCGDDLASHMSHQEYCDSERT